VVWGEGGGGKWKELNDYWLAITVEGKCARKRRWCNLRSEWGGCGFRNKKTWSPGRNLNPEPLAWKTEVLPTTPRGSVSPSSLISRSISIVST
jgi:hypothetical protein